MSFIQKNTKKQLFDILNTIYDKKKYGRPFMLSKRNIRDLTTRSSNRTSLVKSISKILVRFSYLPTVAIINNKFKADITYLRIDNALGIAIKCCPQRMKNNSYANV